MNTQFKVLNGQKLELPLFFPDATRGVLRSLDSVDVMNTKTNGVLVNTLHLYEELGSQFHDVSSFMAYPGAIISDSGGFQVMSLVKKNGKGGVSDEGVTFFLDGQKILFTPEMSITFQLQLGTSLMVILDDFTPPGVSYEQAQKSVVRTIEWAKRSKKHFLAECVRLGISEENRPYLIGVCQGGDFMELREECMKSLVEIGFDGYGYGGWPVDSNGEFNYEVCALMNRLAPADSLLYGLGIGKPEDIVGCVSHGFSIFDCVLPSRDARHGRLFCFNAKTIDEVEIAGDFYSFYYPKKGVNRDNDGPVSSACDCLLCTNYSRSYLKHLFSIGDTTALRLSTIHNLRFYSILLAKLREPLSQAKRSL